MITVFLIVTIFLFLCGVLFLGLRGFVKGEHGATALGTRLQPVNIEALRNLMDPEQDRYLASRLSSAQVRAMRRERAIVEMEYVWRIARNAAIILQEAGSLSRSSSKSAAEEGARIASAALRIRLLALHSIWLLTLSWMWPGKPVSSLVVEGYSTLNFEIDYLKSRTLRPEFEK